MKHKLYSGLLLAAAVLSVAAAIVLPPYLSRLADRRLESAMYSVQAETLDISLDYSMTTAERLALMLQKEEQDRTIVQVATTTDGKTVTQTAIEDRNILTIEDVQPTQDELSAEQAVSLCREELDRLSELLGGVQLYDPFPFDSGGLDYSPLYYLLYDRNSRQNSLSLWTLLLYSGDSWSIQLTMDAETGLLYYLYLHDLWEPIELEEVAAAWGEYLELGTPAIQEHTSEPLTQKYDDNGTVLNIYGSEDRMVATYQTDAGEISYYFHTMYLETSYSPNRCSLGIALYVPQ